MINHPKVFASSKSNFSLAVYISHPIQYFAPLFRELAEIINLHVYYYNDFGQKIGQVDPGFGVPVRWNTPLLEGYEYTILEPVSERARYSLKGSAVLKQHQQISLSMKNRPWNGVLLFGYSFLMDWFVLFHANMKRIPVFLISDSELLHERSWWRLALKEIPVRVFMRGLGGFLAVGNNNAQYARRYGVSENKIYTAALPVDIKHFRRVKESINYSKSIDTLRQKYNISKASKIVLFCGKLVDHKRPLDLVLALNQLGLEQEVVGLFIGDGALKQKILELGHKRVRITGFVNQEEIALYYALGDVLVLPSERDAYGLVVTEAASLGIPSIVSDCIGCVGSDDMLRNNETGLVYRCGDINQLTHLLRTVLNDDQLRMRLGKQALKICEAQSPDVVARSVCKALRAVSAKKTDA
jgi:glycosyltransferase involved in cell wall biosynthesis